MVEVRGLGACAKTLAAFDPCAAVLHAFKFQILQVIFVRMFNNALLETILNVYVHACNSNQWSMVQTVNLVNFGHWKSIHQLYEAY